MIGDNNTNYAYLNRDGTWPDFNWKGLELRGDGALQLHSLPLLLGTLPPELSAAGEPDGAAGAAVDIDGTIYFTDPSKHLVFKTDGCDGTTAPLACIGGEGDTPNRFKSPRGLLIPKHRRTLFVVDSGNHRVQLFDLADNQVVDVWGQASASGPPLPGTLPGLFDTPTALAGDESGNVYIVDHGNRRVQKFNRLGQVVREFWDTVASHALLSQPNDIAVFSKSGKTRVYIVDQEKHSVFLFDSDGQAVRDADGNVVSFGTEQLQKPMGIAASGDGVYVGDNTLRRVLKFKPPRYEYAGDAVGYQGPVAALALDGAGNLLVHPGGSLAPVTLAIGKGYAGRGVLWSSAIRLREYDVNWHRLFVLMEELTGNAHLKLFVHTANDAAAGPAVDPAAPDPFSDAKWRPRLDPPNQYADVTDLYIGDSPAQYLWVGGLFWGDGSSTPVVSQMRVEFDHQTYLGYLPAIYDKEVACAESLLQSGTDDRRLVSCDESKPTCPEALKRLVSLFESMFAGVESETADLSRLFDADAVPADLLGWLAGWLAFELDEDWDEAKKRELIRRAFDLYSRRGTVEGLRESLRIFAGVDSIIEEPIINAAWWALPATEEPCKGQETRCQCQSKGSKRCQCGSQQGLQSGCSGVLAQDGPTWVATEGSILGVTTMLASAHAQGAVLGATATLDGANLIEGDDLGSPLFSDLAHRFTVQIYRGQLRCADTLERVRAVIEREKPAHTDYHLCIIEPLMRVGYQARVGINAVVGGPVEPGALGDSRLGKTMAIGGLPAARAGEETLVGITARVG
ncbi:MAG: phage tail protein I [Blastocatellia bacterium]